MNLASRGLQDFPSQVFNNTDLDPDEKFWECVELLKLDLSHNDITTLPPGWGALTSLTTVIIRGNKLGTAEPLPADLFALPALTSLDLSNNMLERIGEELGGLQGSLLVLNLGANRIKRLPESIVQLRRLESLDVQVCRLYRSRCAFGMSNNVLATGGSGKWLGHLVHLVVLADCCDSTPGCWYCPLLTDQTQKGP